MGCSTCEGQPKNTSKDFTKAVIEINNPEQLVLLRKVVIPSSLGDDTVVPPTIGKYRNVVLVYEANNHIYLYSSDGIPTAIESNVPQEVLDRIAELEDDVDSLERADEELQREIDDLKNSPDVVDIVATYADLQAYDTSTLGDKDVIRVLEDETHSNESTYYRWDKTNNQWVFIGAVEGYYTKDQTDDLLDAKQDLLTPGENIAITDESGDLVISAVDTTYTAGYGLELEGTEFSVNPDIVQDALIAGDNISIEDESGALVISATDTKYTAGSNVQISPQNVISATDTTYTHFTGATASTDGVQGLVPGPLAGDEDKYLKGDGTWGTVQAGPTVVQTTGTSTTDVMSQNAATSMVFDDPGNRARIKIGNGASTPTNSGYSIAIGRQAYAGGNASVAIGQNAIVNPGTMRGVAIGALSSVANTGEVSFGGSSLSGAGYNDSQYRLLTNVYDPQSAHDAATKGYVDTVADGKQDELTAGTGISITDESGALVISATGASIATINAQDWSALWQ